jgi:hypothetical protein
MLPTLQRIYELPVGGTMIAYVGNFEYDIARCERAAPTDKGAPAYKRLLTELQDGMRQLEHSGRIQVARVERKVQRTSNKGKPLEWRDFAYEVTRLA